MLGVRLQLIALYSLSGPAGFPFKVIMVKGGTLIRNYY